MSATLQAIRNKPVGYWTLDDSSPFQDYSGHNRAGTASGTPGLHLPLISGADYAQIFTNTSVGTFDSPVFRRGFESQPFSLEVSFRSIGTGAGEQLVLGHAAQMDGIVVDGTKVSFVTKYLTTGEARATYDIQVQRKIHVVAVHTSEKNMLIVNGVVVAEVTISPEQQADVYTSTATSLSSGTTTSGRGIAVNGVGIYSTALDGESANRNYEAANNGAGADGTATTFGGTRIPLSYTSVPTFLERVWDKDWTTGSRFDSVAEDNGRLVPFQRNNVSLPSSWYNSFVIDTAQGNLYAVNLDWDGVGATVEVSLDGITWQAVSRGINTPLVPTGFSPVGQLLEIRVSFVGGIPEDPAHLERLVVRAFFPGSFEYAGYTVTLSGASLQDAHEPADLRDDWGVYLNAGSITLAPLAATPAPKTIEVWTKAGTQIATNFSATTVYTDGAVGATAVNGEWSVIHFVVPAGVTGNIVLSGTGQIGQVVMYEAALTATQIAQVVESYISIPLLTSGTDSGITMPDSLTEAVIYAHDWTITAAG